MRRPPRNPRTGIFTRPVVTLMTVAGIWTALVNLGLFIWVVNIGLDSAEAMTLTFVSLVIIQFFNAYNFRSDQFSILHRPFANTWLNLAILWELVALSLVVYVPLFQSAFETYSISLEEWVLVVALAATIVPVVELAKWMQRHGWLGAPPQTRGRD